MHLVSPPHLRPRYSSQAHTKLGPGTFSTGGEVPEHLQRLSNVEIHVGLFSRTLADLDRFCLGASGGGACRSACRTHQGAGVGLGVGLGVGPGGGGPPRAEWPAVG